jgi:hypothetical protein
MSDEFNARVAAERAWAKKQTEDRAELHKIQGNGLDPAINGHDLALGGHFTASIIETVGVVETILAVLGEATGALPDPFSEDRLALNFTGAHHLGWRYVALWGAWLQWLQTHWRREDTLRVFELTRRVCREASVHAEKDTLARAVASSKTVAGVERLARNDRRHAMTHDQYDAGDWVINQPPRKE